MSEKSENIWNPNEIIRKLLQEEYSSISGLFHEYQGRLLVNSQLSDADVILLSYHFAAGYTKAPEVDYELVKSFFVAMGRREEAFGKAVYEYTKRKRYLDKKGKKLIILSEGYERLDKILGKLYEAPVILIKSGEQFSAIKKFEEFVKNEVKDEEILLCDPYISYSTIFPLDILKDRVKNIKILTSNITNEDKFKDYINRFKRETNINVEVRRNKSIHDRYLISGEKCWSIGSSIKDLGNKDTIIKEIDEVSDSLRQLFMERWEESEIIV